MLFIQPLADNRADHRGAAQAAAGENLAADLPAGVGHQFHADVVGVNGGPVLGGSAHGNLELARQEGKFRVQG